MAFCIQYTQHSQVTVTSRPPSILKLQIRKLPQAEQYSKYEDVEWKRPHQTCTAVSTLLQVDTPDSAA